ncbi:protein SMAX1-LIKE 3-like isoform X1 [Primulina tabacum]|uniref:protein SMAX1-LIKE 3-like isoform X1 n=1 Tax=Primulina tabacum TaxID=48773 RepID=UPI003F5ACE75
MRAGNCAVQQALTAEAAGIVKQAVTLAKRRGHAQVTPLHVANTMLAVSSGLLRVACLQSHSHPLQCKALELCFNVALNRLPASSSNPVLGHHHSHYPLISNALVAAFKRAQAHQRRGSIENQQQPVLTVKIELEQLIISILDDPSVSRVMREAGFSSTQVKTNVEKSVSLEFRSQNSSSTSPRSTINKSKGNTLLTLHSASPNLASQDEEKTSESIRNEDLNMIIETLLSNKKRKSFVIVGESISNIENTVKGLMHKVDKGELPDALREAKFITLPPFYSFCNLQRKEVEQKMGELTCLFKSRVTNGVVLYLGDLKWISDYRVNLEQQSSYYCSLEHMIMELGRLVSGIGEINGRFWLMGIASFQTYMKCRNGSNSLEAIWGLHPVTIPANSLGLSLLSERDEQIEVGHGRGKNGSCKLLIINGEENMCFNPDYTTNFEAETGKVQSDVPALSSLPPWLKNEGKRLGNNDQKGDSSREFYEKWNSFDSSSQKHPKSHERTLTIFSSSFSSPTSCFSFDQQNPNSHQVKSQIFPMLPEHSPSNPKHISEPGELRHIFSSIPSSTLNSASSGDTIDMEYEQKFKEFSSENLNIICNALEEKVPWQIEIIPEIVGTVLQCRSGMLRRKDSLRNCKTDVKEETWLFFLGHDSAAKEKISRELARIVFGSYSNFVSMGISSFITLTTTDSTEADHGNKRGRDEQSCSSYIERFAQAVSANPHRVFLIEDVEEADYCSQMAVKRAIETGRISDQNCEEVGLCDAIVVLSCDKFSSRSRACSPSKQKMEEDHISRGVSLDLNISFEDFDEDGDQLVDELGILKSVDRRVVFKIQENYEDHEL